ADRAARRRAAGRHRRDRRGSGLSSLTRTVELGSDPEVRFQHALDLAFRYLNRRDRTEVEMRRYLEDKRIEPSQIEGVLSSLREQGYLDDERFARRFAEDKRALEHWGAERIERRLLARGIDRE